MKNNTKTKLNYIFYLFMTSLTYFSFAQGGLLLASINKTASPVWPASGFAIGALLVFGHRLWPAIFIGAVSANLTTDTTFFTALSIAFGNTIEAYLASFLIKKMKSMDSDSGIQLGTTGLLMASLSASSIGASVGTLSLWFANIASWESFGRVWLTWWIGDAVGALVVIPLILEFKKEYLKFEVWNWKKIIETLGIIWLASMALVIGFNYHKSISFIFIILPILLLSYKRLNAFSISLLVATLCSVCVWRTVNASGFFVSKSLNDNLIYLQFLLLSFVIAANLLSRFSQTMLMRRPVTVLLVGWTITALAFTSYRKSEEIKDAERFSDLVEDQTKNIITNFEYYYEALEGGASLYAATQSVSDKQWKAFVDRSQVIERRPGINGVGVIWPVKRENVQIFLKKIRSAGSPEFSIKKVPNVTAPVESADNSYVITFIEPHEENKQARGLDVGSESNRRASADLARDMGIPVITKKIILVQASKKGPGFLLYVPMYKTGKPPQTLEERRKQFLGWIYAPFVTANFLNGALTENSEEFSFFFFEGDALNSESLIYRSDLGTDRLPTFEKQTQIILGQQQFTIGWARTINFYSVQNFTSALIALFGVLGTLLLAGLVANLETTSQRAQSLADKQTQLLKANEISLEEALDKAQRASRIKSEFLANMSHEIRTPMNAIIGMADLLDESPLNNDQKKYVSIFKRAGESLLHVINDILDISKIESGQFKIENVEFNIKTLIDEIVEISTSNAFAKKLTLTFHFDPEVSQNFFGDALRVRQVLMNLVGNATKFTQKGGVTIHLRKNDQPKRRGNILISVKDTGIGIPADKQPSLFQAFAQADSSVTKKYGGTGLGLAISKNLVEMMGGEIWIISNEGIGSEFNFTLDCTPLSYQIHHSVTDQTDSNEAKKVDTKLTSDSALTILLVDDSDDNRTLIKEYLKKTNHKIVEAENGDQAVLKFKETLFDLVLMDMQMPIKDGYAAATEIRKWQRDNNAEDTLIIALTAYALKEEQEKCLKAGCNQHLAKPIKKQTLLSLLSSIEKSAAKKTG